MERRACAESSDRPPGQEGTEAHVWPGSLGSDSLLYQICGKLGLSKREMNARVAKDRVIFRFGDAAWTACGLNPKLAPFYIVVPLLSQEQWDRVRICIRAVADAHAKEVKGQ